MLGRHRWIVKQKRIEPFRYREFIGCDAPDSVVMAYSPSAVAVTCYRTTSPSLLCGAARCGKTTLHGKSDLILSENQRLRAQHTWKILSYTSRPLVPQRWGLLDLAYTMRLRVSALSGLCFRCLLSPVEGKDEPSISLQWCN